MLRLKRLFSSCIVRLEIRNVLWDNHGLPIVASLDAVRPNDVCSAVLDSEGLRLSPGPEKRLFVASSTAEARRLTDPSVSIGVLVQGMPVLARVVIGFSPTWEVAIGDPETALRGPEPTPLAAAVVHSPAPVRQPQTACGASHPRSTVPSQRSSSTGVTVPSLPRERSPAQNSEEQVNDANHVARCKYCF